MISLEDHNGDLQCYICGHELAVQSFICSCAEAEQRHLCRSCIDRGWNTLCLFCARQSQQPWPLDGATHVERSSELILSQDEEREQEADQPIEEAENFEDDELHLEEENAEESPAASAKAIYCPDCKKWINSRTQWKDHERGKKHIKNVKGQGKATGKSRGSPTGKGLSPSPWAGQGQGRR